MMTMPRAAQLALDVQAACNLSGVVRSFAEITSWMRSEQQMDTDTCNRHPVSRLFAEQIAHLTGGGTLDVATYSRAYDWCVQMTRETTVEETAS
jgi:hypothetical protein